MRTFNRYGKRGFTLVELMIVVAIIGVLAALAIYGVTKYLASTKTAEAKNTVGAISRAASLAWDRETTTSDILPEGTASGTATHSLCDSATEVPAGLDAAVPAGTKYQPSTAAGADFNGGTETAGWTCLKFSLSQPIIYQYHYLKDSTITGGLPGAPVYAANSFEAAAKGNIDGDTGTIEYSTFARGGTVSPNGQLVLATQVFIDKESE